MTNTPIFNCITDINRKTWHLSLYGNMKQNWWGLFPAIPLPTVHSIWLRITDNFWHLCGYRGLFCTVFIYPGLQEFIFNRTFKNAVNTKYANCINKRIPTPKVYFPPQAHFGAKLLSWCKLVDTFQILNGWGSFLVKQNAYKNLNKREYLDIYFFLSSTTRSL